MGPVTEIFVYPLLFLALFFEVFTILSFFDREARRRRMMIGSDEYPSVAIIMPCYNEENTIRASIESLLALDYPKEKFSIIAVNDGSIDGTGRVLSAYRGHAQVTILEKENGGKHTALNLGIEHTDAELIGCLDADSFASPDALKEIVAHFDDPKVGAVTASLSVNKPRSMIEHMQQAEYLIGIVCRHILATLNGLYVAPGPLTVYRASLFKEIGGFRAAHNTEDMEMALRMQRGGWRIGNAPRARVYTTAPKTVLGLVAQRTRWTTGFIRNGYDYRNLFGNPSHGILGLMVLPLGIVAILAGILLFGLAVMNAGTLLWNFLESASRVPISYTFSMPEFDIFFFPVSALTMISAVALCLMIAFVFVGARISRTRSTIGVGIFWYAFCYGFIAPLWLMRSVFDTALGIRRSWR